jgi:hypothetical protein
MLHMVITGTLQILQKDLENDAGVLKCRINLLNGFLQGGHVTRAGIERIKAPYNRLFSKHFSGRSNYQIRTSS